MYRKISWLMSESFCIVFLHVVATTETITNRIPEIKIQFDLISQQSQQHSSRHVQMLAF